MTDHISRADAICEVLVNDGIENIVDRINALPSADVIEFDFNKYQPRVRNKVNDDTPSADAVQGWRIGKPTEQGEYMVTLDSFGHKHIDLFYYGKPLMPNRKVRGKCWYRSDDEWGDVVYDDKDILAWMPLPKPYREDGEV